MYNWLIVMKNREKLFIQHQYNKVEDLINELLPKEINSRTFTIAILVTPDKYGNTSVVINGDEISHILFKGN